MAGAPWKSCASMSSARCEQRLRLALFLMPGTGYNGLGWVHRLLTLLWTIAIGFFFLPPVAGGGTCLSVAAAGAWAQNGGTLDKQGAGGGMGICGIGALVYSSAHDCPREQSVCPEEGAVLGYASSFWGGEGA